MSSPCKRKKYIVVSSWMNQAKLLLDEEQNTCGINYKKNKTSLQRINDIETLSERLGFLKITNKASSEMNERSDKKCLQHQYQ